jgi:hypothetical protein
MSDTSSVSSAEVGAAVAATTPADKKVSNTVKEIEVAVKLPVKEKKPRTEAQKAASTKALAVLAARRAAKKAEADAVKNEETVKKTTWKAVKKRTPEVATKADVEAMMGLLTGLLKPAAATAATAATAEKPLPVAYEKPLPVASTKPLAPVVAAPTAPKKLTGHELLDTIFFS